MNPVPSLFDLRRYIERIYVHLQPQLDFKDIIVINDPANRQSLSQLLLLIIRVEFELSSLFFSTA